MKVLILCQDNLNVITMILIVDSNIVENVYKEEDKFFLSECYVNLLKLGEVYVYVSLPSSIEDGVTYKCEIGSLIIKEICNKKYLIEDKELLYWGIKEKTENYFKANIVECNLNAIKISDNICISKFEVTRCTKRLTAINRTRYIESGIEIRYHYEIQIQIGNNSITHVFKMDDIIIKDYDRGVNRDKVNSMECLFKFLIPSINSYIDSNRPLSLINVNRLEKFLPIAPNYVSDSNSYSINEAMNLIYYMQIESYKDKKLIRFGKNLEGSMNYYIADLFNNILNIDLKYDVETRTSYAYLTNHLSEYKLNEDSIKENLSLLLYIGLIKFYDAKKANQDYLVGVPIEGINLSSLLNKIDKVDVTDELQNIFRFIYGMRAEHIMDGQTRVGRDDIEWFEKTYEFPLSENYKPSLNLIKKINELLNINLVSIIDKYSSKPAYYYHEIYDKDYISGLACSRTDLDSEGFRKDAFFTLIFHILDCYLNKIEEFNTFNC